MIRLQAVYRSEAVDTVKQSLPGYTTVTMSAAGGASRFRLVHLHLFYLYLN